MARKVDVQAEIEKFLNQYEKLKTIKAQSLANLSESDTKLSALYHKIEGAKITHVSQSHNLIMELKEVLSKRRLDKRDAMLSQSIIDNMGGAIGTAKKKNKQTLIKHKQVEDEITRRAKE